MKNLSNTLDWEILLPDVVKYSDPRIVEKPIYMVKGRLQKKDLMELSRKLYQWKNRLRPDEKEFWQEFVKDTVRKSLKSF
jgi:hypothetical protein